MRKRRRHRRHNNFMWIYSVIASFCLLTMGVGYAILSAENNIQIDVIKTNPPKAEDTIKELLGSNSSVASGTGTLEKIEQPATEQTGAQTEYRYRGANPNNYVTFNNELWRIIGIVDGKVKLIRNESIGDYVWNNERYNYWPQSSLYNYLNESYYNQLNIKSKEMIEENFWHLSGTNTSDIKVELVYQSERSGVRYADGMGFDTYCKGKIGLMYPSDYGYAASSSCSNSYELSEYGNCKNKNWLFKNNVQWTITAHTDFTNYVFLAFSDGNVYSFYSSGTVDDYYFAVRPTLYLKSNVLISRGDGSSSKPYQLTLS